MTVYICTVGERGEGYGIRKIYRDESRALNWLQKQRDDSDNPTPIKTIRPGHFQFRVYCDIYTVRAMELE